MLHFAALHVLREDFEVREALFFVETVVERLAKDVEHVGVARLGFVAGAALLEFARAVGIGFALRHDGPYFALPGTWP